MFQFKLLIQLSAIVLFLSMSMYFLLSVILVLDILVIPRHYQLEGRGKEI